MEIEVEALLTISKKFRIDIQDYDIVDVYTDKNGIPSYKIECKHDLKDELASQVILPTDAYKHVGYPLFDSSKKPYEDLKDWKIESFEVEEL